MSNKLLGCVCVGTLVLGTAARAQNPPASPQQTPPSTRTPAMQDLAQTVTVEGCLVREQDVPGRKPNVAERAGIMEDYILTTTKMVKGKAPAAVAGQKRGDPPTGASGTRGGAMYEVGGISDEQLKSHLGQRVQIDGTFENVDRAQATPEKETPADDLVGLRGTVIRSVAGKCPAK